LDGIEATKTETDAKVVYISLIDLLSGGKPATKQIYVVTNKRPQ